MPSLDIYRLKTRKRNKQYSWVVKLVFYLPEEKLDIKTDDITDWFPRVSHIIHQKMAHRGHDSLYNKTGRGKHCMLHFNSFYTVPCILGSHVEIYVMCSFDVPLLHYLIINKNKSLNR